MSSSPKCFALAQITSLVGSISKKNYRANCSEIAKLVDMYGFEADKHLFRCLVSSVDFVSEGRNSGKDGQQLQLLIQEANSVVTKPNFVSILCYSFEKQESKGLRPSSQLLSQIAKVLKLARVQEVVFALGLTNSSDVDLKAHASQHLRNKLPELIRSYSDLSSGLEGGFGDLAIEVLHILLSHIILNPEEEVGVSSDTVQTFIETLRRDFPRERVPVVLAPLLYREQQDITEDRLVPVSVSLPSSVYSIRLADIIKEIGYPATASKQDMLEILKDYGKSSINPKEVAQVFGMMASTLSGLPEGVPFMGLSSDSGGKVASTWDVRIFTSSVQSLLPTFNWREVILNLDYPNFHLDSPEGLGLIMTGFKSVCRDPFPLETIYLGWSCTSGQLSFLKQAIVGCPQFSIAQFPLCSMQLSDDLKANLNSEEVMTWRSLSLVESLLQLSEQGHYEEVMELLKQPMNVCPEILFLGVIRTQRGWRLVQQEVISKLLPHFISNHSSYSTVLREAFKTSSMSPHIQHLLVKAMSDWYLETEPVDSAKILSILEMAMELKVLPTILAANHFPFIIELACWAAKRDYLKLEKWFTDKIRDYKLFMSDCIHFLMLRAPQPLVQPQERFCLTTDIILTLLSCLNSFKSSLKPDLMEKLNNLIATHGPLPTKPARQHFGPMLDLSGFGSSSFGGGMLGGMGSPGSPVKNNSNLGSAGFPGLQGGSQMSGQGLFGMGGTPESFSPYLGGTGMGLSGGGAVGQSAHMKLPPQSLHLPQQQQQQQQAASKQGGGEAAGVFGSEQSFSKEVDDKANSYFQAIYNRGMSVDRLLDELKKFKESPNKKDRDLYMCMLRNMFEEYKFFPQFPEKELQITGQLFGGIIEHGLVTYLSLSLALRYVLQSLKNPPSSKIYLFGLAALDKFKRRLHEFSQYCASIASIPHFPSFPEQLKQYVHYGQQSMEPPSATVPSGTPMTPFAPLPSATPGSHGGSELGSNTPLTVPNYSIQPLSSINTSSIHSNFSSGSSPLGSPLASVGVPLSPHTNSGNGSPGSKPGGAAGSPMTGRREPPSINNTNIDTLLVAADQQSEKPPPPEELQDKIHFLFNNLSSSNLQEKTEEAAGLISEDHISWVAQYLVMKRASIEPNFHGLYMNFLDLFGSVHLRKRVLKETYRNIKVILQADKTSNNFSDRAILKNLGHWLGMQTLAKNKPILQIDLALKDLILEAHYKGQQELLYVVPFVAKVLESCADSQVFKPPNPWTMAIMSVLSELHAVPDLKLNLRFEVEVLCKHLPLEISDITPSKLLGNVDKAKTLSQLSAPKPDPSPVDPPPVSSATAASSGGITAPQPQFHVDDINTSSLAGLSAHLQINPQISLLQRYPQLKQCVKPSVEKAVQDLLGLVVERSIKVALTTTEHIIKKDFSLDPDLHRMHMAAQHMVRNLTAGMALITCREPLLLSISSNLKTAFITSLRTPGEDVKSAIDQASQQISAENTELACAFIQKTAMEKAMPEMEKRLTEEFELRKLARSDGRRYCNTAALTYQAERMPEQIRLIVGGPSQQQAAVYEEFARSLPGFLPNTNKETSYTGKAEFIANEDFLQILMKCIHEINQHLRVALAPSNNPHIVMMRSLLEMTMQLRITQNHVNVITLLQKALEGLLEGMNPPPSDPELFVSFRDCHLLILKMIQSHSGLGPVVAMHHVTRILLGAREEIKYSPRAIILLIGMQIVDMSLLDEYLAKAIENGRNLVALSCSIKLINAILSAEKRETPITDKDLLKTKDTLYRLAANVKFLPDSSGQLLEPFRLNHDIQLIPGGAGILSTSTGVDLDRAPGAPTAGMIPANLVVGPTTELEDPPGLYEKVEYLLSEWVRHFHQPGLLREGDKIYAAYVARLQQQGILKSDDLITRFFRISVEMCVDLCYRTLNDQSITASMARAKCYHTMDAFVKLVVVLVRYSGDASNTVTKVNLLNKVLVTVSHVLIQDHEHRHGEFHQLAYHRFFIMLLNDLGAPDPVFEAISFPVLHSFRHVFHIIRPSRAPGFAYSWLELISHRTFIAKLLLHTPQQKGWPLFHQLLIDLFKFLAPFLRNAELTKPTQLLYKGTLRVLLVLLHDFPEFLCDYHFSFCDVIPPNCIQMRNLILSAFPRNMRLPDPFTPNLKVETLPDIAHAPRILPAYTEHIQPTLKKDLDNYIRTRAPVTFLQDLRVHLTVSTEPGNQYNVSLMNALVLYVGTQAIAYIHSKERTPSTGTIAHTAHMDIFQHLVVDLDTEGRYLFLNAIANQLRYPNSHTHYFSCALLSLFAETNAEAIQEQITRVLLERLIVNRPHPWGLLITFIELIKNPSYNFWKHEFVHCAPEIEKLFGSVAKSCMQKQPASVGREEVHD